MSEQTKVDNTANAGVVYQDNHIQGHHLSCADYKNDARQHLKGKLIAFIIASCPILIINLAFARICNHLMADLARFFFSGVTFMAPVALAMTIIRGRSPTVSEAFSGIKPFGRNLLAGFLVGLECLIWSLLFIIPGIVKYYSYSATFYILKDDPKIGANAALLLSRKIMDGHKMEAFILRLSFIGWWLLVLATFGVAGFYVVPYYSVALAEFYCKLISNYHQTNKQTISHSEL